MPFDLIGFSEATPGTGTVNIAKALGDNLYGGTLDDILLNPEAPYLLGAFYSALTTPSRLILRQPKRIDIDISKAVRDTDLDVNIGWTHLFHRPMLLNANDKLNALSVNATDEITTVGLIVGSGKITRSAQEAVRVDHIIRGIADQAVTAHTWTTAAITWVEALEAGKYAIVGMRGVNYKAATPSPALARLVIPGQTSWRPGVPLNNAVGDKTIPMSRHEPWAEWPLMADIAFDTKVGYPNCEVLCATANTDFVIELALQKIA
jgi:hypothetical protein